MTHSLRKYQVEDLKHLSKHNCVGCFNEQRTGKTPTAIAWTIVKRLKKVLIVCPASMAYPWKTAWEEWTNKPAVVCNGPRDKRERIITEWKSGPLIISYGCLRDTKTNEGAYKLILEQNPDGCIADEAHRFKDPGTNTAQAMYQLAKGIPNRIALTGTPATNKPADIFGILRWLRPGVYKSYWRFVNDNFSTREVYTGGGRRHREIVDWRPGRQAIIAEELSEFTTQRKRIDVMNWLPQKDYLDVKLPATKQQIKYLDELNRFFETETLTVQGVLDRILRTRQICVAPEIVGLSGSSPKIDWLMDYINDYPERPILVFTKFVKAIDIILSKLEKKGLSCGVIRGSTTLKHRAECVNDFQNEKINIMLLQIDAAKEGLTLDRAETIIFLDQFPPAADIQQAEDRFIATTPDKANKSHQIIRLILDKTYDVMLYKLVERRASGIDAINNYIKYIRKEETDNGTSIEHVSEAAANSL